MIIDIILLVILALVFVRGYKKGFVKAVWKFAALIITILLVIALKDCLTDMLLTSRLASGISDKISSKINIPQGGGIDIAQSLNLPYFIRDDMTNRITETVGSVNDVAVEWLTHLCIMIIACVILFIVIRLLLAGVYMIINGIVKLPAIKSVNKLSGGVFAVVNAIFILFLIFSLLALFAPADGAVFEAIEKTYLVKYLYNYNILLKLFLKS